MKIQENSPIIDEILEKWRTTLDKDFVAYRNHCYRVLNFFLAFCNDSTETINKGCIAVAFHDLGIWTKNTYDYLLPSKQLACEYLTKTDQAPWIEEIEAMIENHHKISKYKANPDWLVEPFRKSDWIDVSRGKFKYGLSSTFVSDVMSRLPNAGFHKRLIALTKQRFKTHPFNPLPMMRL